MSYDLIDRAIRARGSEGGSPRVSRRVWGAPGPPIVRDEGYGNPLGGEGWGVWGRVTNYTLNK